MSKLYWKSKIIATDSSEYINFIPGSISGMTSVTVGSAIREVATTKTGIKMSKSLAVGTTTFSFTNINFNDSMYVETYDTSEKDFCIESRTYNDTTKTITFKCRPVETALTFRIVVKF